MNYMDSDRSGKLFALVFTLLFGCTGTAIARNLVMLSVSEKYAYYLYDTSELYSAYGPVWYCIVQTVWAAFFLGIAAAFVYLAFFYKKSV